MKTLNDIKEQVAKEKGYISWSQLYHECRDNKVSLSYYVSIYDLVCNRYAEQAIEECAKQATGYLKGHGIKVDQESILKIKEELK